MEASIQTWIGFRDDHLPRLSEEQEPRVLRDAFFDLGAVQSEPHPLSVDEPGLAAHYDAAAPEISTSGERAGNPTLTLVVSQNTAAREQNTAARETTGDHPVAEVRGVNVHAKQRVDGRDRPQLERLCRYIIRPPLVRLDLRSGVLRTPYVTPLRPPLALWPLTWEGVQHASFFSTKLQKAGISLSAASICVRGGSAVSVRSARSVTIRSGVPGGNLRTHVTTLGANFNNARICVTRIADKPLRRASSARERTARQARRRWNSTARSRSCTILGGGNRRFSRRFLSNATSNTKGDAKFIFESPLGRPWRIGGAADRAAARESERSGSGAIMKVAT
jgi:hypothetical protein